ncbi:MAG: metalloendopeptidase-like membrane protein [Stygiobacter sp.]|nr:MAG: metalloendopeptidase-like membrane protein [Stygiobacter sp.]KAF0211620.1 MAG: metalloendopeptidase-like membrane [Ignavibacteria bacterium]
MKKTMAFIVICSLLLSCNNDVSDNEKTTLVDKKYVLPYPIGTAYTCSQGFNMFPSHSGSFSYSVDFGMPIRTLVTAARSGRVVYILESYSDDDPMGGHENVVIILHEDSTYARYVHLTRNGSLVQINQMVVPGDPVGLSGNSGSSGSPHLHFDVTKTFGGRSDQTIPFDFKNTSPHPVGLERGVAYTALPY